MQSFNHVAGGFAFAGIFASFADVNVFERFDVMAVVWVAAVLPDIDHTKSLIGKTCYPLARWLQTKYGHRTVTHSIFFYLASVCMVKGIDNLFHLNYTLPFALALASHLIFDMCTVNGIPLFYPFSKISVVLPANPKLRLSGSDFRSEAIIFLLFCCMNVFSYPLMAQGFWSRYHQGFASYDHLESEMQRKPGDYAIMVLEPAQNDTIVGLLVEQKPGELILYNETEKRFLRVDKDRYKFLNFLKRKKGRHEFKTINLLQVSCDSLNFYMKQPVVKVTVQADSSNQVYYFEGPIMKQGTTLSADYPNEARFQQLAIDNAETQFQLKMLDAEYNTQIRKYAITYGKYRADIVELKDLEKQTNLSDYDEGKRRMRVLELRERIKNSVAPEPVNTQVYKIRREMLLHKLKETAHVNATVLVWSAEHGRQN